MSPRKISAGGHWLQGLRGRGPRRACGQWPPATSLPFKGVRPWSLPRGGREGVSPARAGGWRAGQQYRINDDGEARGDPRPPHPLRGGHRHIDQPSLTSIVGT